MDMTSDKTSRSQRLLLTVAVVATLLLAGLGVRWLTAPDSSPLAHLPTPPPLLEAIGPIPMYGVQIVVALAGRSEEHTSELQSRGHLVCRLLLEKKKTRQ